MYAQGCVTFGELLLRLDPCGFERFVQADRFEARYTGAEANVAVSLATFGIEAFAVSKVPNHEIGQACINCLRRFGVRTEFIARGGDRLGILFVETGASQRPTRVIYDRSHSSFRDLVPEEFDWDRILSGKQWFHFSGTAPALGENVLAALEAALDASKRLGVRTSCDCNYRSSLWGPEEAGRVLSKLMNRVDVFVGGVEDPEKIFGVTLPPGNQGDEKSHAEHAAIRLQDLFGFSWVALTLRAGSSSSQNRYAGMVRCSEGSFYSHEYEIQIVDRIGAGDAFSAGIVFQILSGANPSRVVEFAAAAACFKHTILGDFNHASVQEIDALLEGGQSGRVQR
jgi:2-dehydro-3-deoxygluconokinase